MKSDLPKLRVPKMFPRKMDHLPLCQSSSTQITFFETVSFCGHRSDSFPERLPKWPGDTDRMVFARSVSWDLPAKTLSRHARVKSPPLESRQPALVDRYLTAARFSISSLLNRSTCYRLATTPSKENMQSQDVNFVENIESLSISFS